MPDEHPNISLLKQLDLRNLSACGELFSDNVTWHFFNPRLPDLEGDYVGISGIKSFFEKLRLLTAGTFRVEPVSVQTAGDELVIAHTRNSMRLQGREIETDVVLVWRIVAGRIKEVWDIPSVYVNA